MIFNFEKFMKDASFFIRRLTIITAIIFANYFNLYAESPSEHSIKGATSEMEIEVEVGHTATCTLPYSVTTKNPYNVTYENRAPQYLEISNETNYSCTVKGLKDSGNMRVYITAHYYYILNNKAYSNIFNFSVKVKGNSDIGGGDDSGSFRLTEHDVSLKVGESHQLKYTFSSRPANVTWDWSRSGIVSLNQTGMIVGVKPGKVQIYANTSDGRYDTCNITVEFQDSPSLNDNDILEGETEEGHCLYFTVISAQEKTAKTGVNIGDSFYTAKYTTDRNTITIPSFVSNCKVVRIGKLSFAGNFMKKNFSLILPETVTNIEQSAFLQNPNLESINIIPEGMTELPSQCFDRCTALSSIRIPNSIKTLDYACLRRTNIHEFKVEDSSQLSNIYLCAFEGCTKLREIDLGKNISCIHCEAFKDCPSIETITIHNDNCPVIFGGNDLFYWDTDMYDRIELYVPNERIAQYRSDYVFGKFKNILPINENSSIEDINAESRLSAEPIFYSLQGIRCKNPSHGFYIQIENGKSYKVWIP